MSRLVRELDFSREIEFLRLRRALFTSSRGLEGSGRSGAPGLCGGAIWEAGPWLLLKLPLSFAVAVVVVAQEVTELFRESLSASTGR